MSHKTDSDRALSGWLPIETFVHQFLEQAWDFYGLIDVHGHFVHVSRGFSDILGCIPSGIDQVVDFIDFEYRIDVHKLISKSLQSDHPAKLEFRAKRANDLVIWLECKAIPIRDQEGEIAQVAFVLNDITLRKNHEAQLVALAFHDPLTALPNRRMFEEHLQQQQQQAKRTDKSFALFYLDIDDFKIINDTMGHHIGDAFLQQFAGRIQGCLRGVDMFARMGGDEFTILLPAVDCEEHVDGVAKRIVQCVDQPWEIEGHRFRATVSMGITMYRSGDTDAAAMMKQVDAALYQVKGKGRNNYQFFDGCRMTTEVSHF